MAMIYSGGGEDDMHSFDMTQLRIPLERAQQQRGRQEGLQNPPQKLDVLQGSSHVDITMHEPPINIQTEPTQTLSYVSGRLPKLSVQLPQSLWNNYSRVVYVSRFPQLFEIR